MVYLMFGSREIISTSVSFHSYYCMYRFQTLVSGFSIPTIYAKFGDWRVFHQIKLPIYCVKFVVT